LKLPSLKIRNIESRFPVIQAGMGVRVGNSVLAGKTALLGGYGTIASVGLGDIEKSKTSFAAESNRVLREEILKARELSEGKGPIGVNIMVALSNYRELVEESVRSGADFIISGAGLPLFLPEYAGNADIALIPVVSSGRALSILLSAWKRKYKRAPDAIIVEGPMNGGHLGFTMEQVANPETCSIEKIFDDIKTITSEMGYSSIPVIAAEMAASREDITRLLAIGYNGVQIGTYFIASEEAGIDRRSKEFYVKAKRGDVIVMKSPVGLPVRVLKSPLVERILSGQREKFTCPYRCLRTCAPGKVSFCIAKALLATWRGDIENGLFMCGCNVEAAREIYPLEKFFKSLEN
jgi:NAD(P)H-dependent flavin oxidoreductase YrpB (nitropropane dioxygenase family)